MKLANEQWEAEKASLNAIIDDVRAQLAKRNQEFTEMLTRKTATITDLEERLAATEALLEERNKLIASMNRRLMQHSKLMAEKNILIDEKNLQLMAWIRRTRFLPWLDKIRKGQKWKIIKEKDVKLNEQVICGRSIAQLCDML